MTAPGAIAAADLDGDGRADLAVLPGAAGFDLGILHNQGDGTFAPGAQIPLSMTSVDIAAADVDGDGVPDLLVALGDPSMGSGSVAVIRNHGDGTFAPAVYVPAGSEPSAFVVADLNGDGAPDLALVGKWYNTLTVVMNQGDGTFLYPVEIQFAGLATTIASADLDHDGLADLAITVGNSLDVFLNKGGGSFGPAASYDMTLPITAGQALVAADFDGDGWADLAVGGGFEVVILRNQHDGTFAASHTTGAQYPGVAVDLNGDGAPDLVFPGVGVDVVMNQGDGTFGGPVGYGAGDYPDAVAAADFDGDGRPDLAVADAVGNTVSVLFNACLP